MRDGATQDGMVVVTAIVFVGEIPVTSGFRHEVDRE